MKKFIKERFPLIFRLLKNIYTSTSYYRNKAQDLYEINELNKIQREKEEVKIMNEVFDDNYTIQNGPFKGMKYIKRSSGSALLPKILGSYEEPIQKWVEEVVEKKKYQNIIDIGCAEGYYACGFAKRLPNSKITAYDIDKEARKNTAELMKVNNLTNIEIKAECTHSELNEKSIFNTLVFCDIEGFEKILLDPIKVPNLKNVDLIIETHDCFISNITEELISRFYMTHIMRIIVDYPFRVNKYSTPNDCSEKIMEYITNERRSKYMKFIYMEHINENY